MRHYIHHETRGRHYDHHAAATMNAPTPAQIKQTRLAAGLTVITSAKLMGVTRRTIYSWEDGTHGMKPRLYEHMLRLLAGGGDV